VYDSHVIIIKKYGRGHVRKRQLSVSCDRCICFNARHRCQARSAAVCQFAQHTAAAEIIPAAASSTGTTDVTSASSLPVFCQKLNTCLFQPSSTTLVLDTANLTSYIFDCAEVDVVSRTFLSALLYVSKRGAY